VLVGDEGVAAVVIRHLSWLLLPMKLKVVVEVDVCVAVVDEGVVKVEVVVIRLLLRLLLQANLWVVVDVEERVKVEAEE